MSDFEGMSDAELNAVIFDSEPTDHGEEVIPVSPTTEEFEEETPESEPVTDVGQPENEEENLDEDSTDEDQTDDNEEETPTEDDESDEDDTDLSEDKDTEADDNESEQVTKYQPLKANGKEYPIDNIDELYKLASAGVGAQQKYQAIAGHKKEIMAADKADVNLMEAINMMANYKADPKAAIVKLLKDNNIDPMDIDTDVEVAPSKDHSVSDFEAKYDEVVGEIGNSPVFPKVQEVLLKTWDEASRNVFLDKPEMIKQLHEEMLPMNGSDKSMFDLVSPIAEKMKLSGDSRSDFDIYMEARGVKAQEFQKHEEAVKKATPPKKPKANVNNKKKAAAPTKGKSTGSKTLDFASMSDADLDAFLEKA